MRSGKIPCTRQAVCGNQVLGCDPIAEEFSRVTSRPVAEVGGKAGLADADVDEFVHQTEVLRRDEVRAVDEDHWCVLVYEREAEKLFGVQLPGRVVAHDAVYDYEHTCGFDATNELVSCFAPRCRVSGPVGCKVNFLANDVGSFPDSRCWCQNSQPGRKGMPPGGSTPHAANPAVAACWKSCPAVRRWGAGVDRVAALGSPRSGSALRVGVGETGTRMAYASCRPVCEPEPG